MGTRSEQSILNDIKSFAPIEEEWLDLDNLLDELWSVEPSEKAIPLLLGVFDRFPEDDGAGVFWGIVHGLEATFPGVYESHLMTSAANNLTMFKQIMLQRIENSSKADS